MLVTHFQAQLHHQHIEQWHEEDGQEGRGQYAADYPGTNGLTAHGAGAGAQRQRQYAEGEGQRGHQNRAQTHPCRFQSGGYQFFARFKLRFGKFHDQDGVFRRQTNGGQQTHLEVHVVAQLTQYRRQQGTQHAQRYHHHH